MLAFFSYTSLAEADSVIYSAFVVHAEGHYVSSHRNPGRFYETIDPISNNGYEENRWNASIADSLNIKRKNNTSSNIASFLFNSPFLEITTKIKAENAINKPVTIGKICLIGLIGCIREITPIVSRQSERTLPKIFPKPISPCFFELLMEKINSGIHVPIATTKPMRKRGSANSELNSCAPSVATPAPTRRKAKLARRIAVSTKITEFLLFPVTFPSRLVRSKRITYDTYPTNKINPSTDEISPSINNITGRVTEANDVCIFLIVILFNLILPAYNTATPITNVMSITFELKTTPKPSVEVPSRADTIPIVNSGRIETIPAIMKLVVNSEIRKCLDKFEILLIATSAVIITTAKPTQTSKAEIIITAYLSEF